MRFSKLGSTDLDVSLIGFGASPLGSVFGDVSQEAADRAVASAIESGINLFDVSPYYGMTLAEERLGAALGSQRRNVLLSTKCGRYGADVFDFSAQTITASFESSLQRLRTDHVEVLLAHDIEFGDLAQIVGETIPAMQRLKEQGKVRFIGLSSYWPGLLAHVASQTNVDCVLNYCHANLFADDMDAELVPAARQLGFGLLNASPLHMGLLADKAVPGWHPAPVCVREAALAIRSACGRHATDAGTLALHVCLQHSAVASTFVGISSESEVTAACAALDWTPDAGLLQVVQQIVAPVHNIVWPSGRPENQDAALRTKGLCHVAD